MTHHDEISTVTVPSDVAVRVPTGPAKAPGFARNIVTAIQSLYAVEELTD